MAVFIDRLVNRTRLKLFSSSQDGTATVEAVLWLPVFLTLLCLVADTSAIFGREDQIMRIVQNANRGLAVGYFPTAADAQTYISNEVKVFSQNSAVSVAINKGIISSTVSLPVSDLTLTGLIKVFSGLKIQVSASQMLEV